MSNKAQNAAEAVLRVGRDFQAVIDLAAELGRVGDLEAAHETTTRQLELARIDLAEANRQLENARQAVLAIADEASKKGHDANVKCNALLERAHADAAEIRDEAASDAEKIRSVARDVAESTKQEARRAAEAAASRDASELELRQDKLSALQLKIELATKALDDKTEVLRSTEARIAEVHASLSKLNP